MAIGLVGAGTVATGKPHASFGKIQALVFHVEKDLLPCPQSVRGHAGVRPKAAARAWEYSARLRKETNTVGYGKSQMQGRRLTGGNERYARQRPPRHVRLPISFAGIRRSRYPSAVILASRSVAHEGG